MHSEFHLVNGSLIINLLRQESMSIINKLHQMINRSIYDQINQLMLKAVYLENLRNSAE